MSDLFCPATLILARHAEAEHETETGSDDGGSLTRAGRRQAGELAERLRGRRVAHVYTSPMPRAVQTAEIAAANLDLDVTVLRALQEVSVGEFAGTSRGDDQFSRFVGGWLDGDIDARVPGGESGREVTTRLRYALEGISDLHRGESVLVVCHGGLLRATAPAIARLDHGITADRIGNSSTVEVQIDADGIVCTAWDPPSR